MISGCAPFGVRPASSVLVGPPQDPAAAAAAAAAARFECDDCGGGGSLTGSLAGSGLGGELTPFCSGGGENGLACEKGEPSENLATFLRSGMAGALFSLAGTGGGALLICEQIRIRFYRVEAPTVVKKSLSTSLK